MKIRKNQISHRNRLLIFSTLELLRKTMKKTMPNSDWKDIDDYIFSELDFTRSEIKQVYKGRNTMVYTQSTINDDNWYDKEHICDWCKGKFPVSELNKEIELGYLCDNCKRAIESRGETLTFIEE